jgi:sugar phosphate isomerase/epimerase
MKHNLIAVLPLVCGLAAGALVLQGAERPKSRAGVGPSFKGPVGLQLYSLRDSFKSDVPATLNKVRNFGFKHVELAGTYGLAPERFKQLLAQYGLKPVAGHFPYEKYRDDVDSVAREAKALGIKYAGCAWIPHEGDFTEKACRETAAVFNRAGEALARHGIRFFYHIHGYEFQPHPGGTLFDLLMQETNPRYVTYEMDIFWVVFPAQDPVKLLEKYGKRWELMHLKDMNKGVQLGSLAGGTDVRNDVTLGAGQIDLPRLLRAAKKAGVKWYFLEDESPSVEIQLPDSLQYLEDVRF